MKKSSAAAHSENHFIREWNGTEFNLSIPAKITHSNKPFIYFYWANPDRHARLERARKGGIGGVNDSRISVKKKAVAAVDAIIQMLGRGWNPFTNAYTRLGVQIDLDMASPVSKCLDVWLEHRQERYESNMIGRTALKNNTIVVRHFRDWLEIKGFTDRKIGTFNSVDIDSFLGYKMNQLKWGKVTYNTYRCDLGTFFSYLKKFRVVQENPVSESAKKNTRRDSSRFAIYEERELQTVVRLMEGDPAYFGLYVASKMLYLYNIRPVEMTRLQVRDVDWAGHRLTLPPHKTKNGSEAVFELNEEMYGLLEQLAGSAGDAEFIFGHRCRTSATQIDEGYFTQKFRYFRIRYGISNKLKFYALKHSSNFYDLEDGASFYSIMEKNRHSSLQVTNDYIRNRLLKKTVKPTINSRF